MPLSLESPISQLAAPLYERIKNLLGLQQLMSEEHVYQVTLTRKSRFKNWLDDQAMKMAKFCIFLHNFLF